MARADAEELTAWVRTSFPDFAWEDADIRFGAHHDVVVGSAEHVVCRVVHGSDHAARAVREGGILRSVAGVRLDVQIPHLVAGVVSDDVRSGYVISRLPGRPDPAADWRDLRAAYTALLAQLVDVPHTGLDLPPARTWCGGADFPRVVDTQLAPLLGGGRAHAAVQAVEALTALPPTSEPSFVHGDFGPHNVLWEDSRPVSLIDLDHACVDDPAIDLAPLVGIYGADDVADIAPDRRVRRAMVHRATLSLQVAAAAHLAGDAALRDHALGNFTERLDSGTLHDPRGGTP